MRDSNFIWVWGRATLRRSAIYQVNGLMDRGVESACCTARLPACQRARCVSQTTMVALCDTRAGWHARGFPLGQVSSPVSFYLWRMAAGGGGQDRPEWGRGRRLTQLRGIASGGCLDDSDWKSTIVPSTHAVSEAYRSFKNPTLSWNPAQHAQLLREAGQHSEHNCPACPRPSAHIFIMCRSPAYQQDDRVNSKTC